ncbi:hypothetical protein MJL48_29175, partial [Salmonella enterica subsp. enterica serovar Kentucky]|nr:hypothetical protein [Salmonella enterica subsp. enterica serovar Kentucky]
NARWKWTTDYNRRSIAETAMYRVKQLFGGSLTLRDYDGQVAEEHVTMSGTITVPQSCSINAGQVIEVRLPDIEGKDIRNLGDSPQ